MIDKDELFRKLDEESELLEVIIDDESDLWQRKNEIVRIKGIAAKLDNERMALHRAERKP